MTTTPQDSETPETDACEKAIDDFWNDPNRSPGLVESMEEAKKSGIISPLTKCRQLERRAIAAERDNEMAFYQLFHADVSSESEIKVHGYKVKDLVCILIAQRDSLRSQVLQLEKENVELKQYKDYYGILLGIFRHVHVNNGADDFCKECGLDLRNDIHVRLAAPTPPKQNP